MGEFRWIWKPKRSEYYHYRFTIAGRQFGGSTGTSNAQQAEKIAKRKRKDALLDFQRMSGNGREMTFERACCEFMDSCGQFLATSKDIERALHWILARLPEGILVREIDSRRLNDLIALRRSELRRGTDRALSPATVNRSVTAPLRRVLNFARDILGVEVKPIAWRQLLLREADPRSTQVTPDDQARLIGLDPDGYGAVVSFALKSALRLRNLVELQWSQVDFGSRCIVVRQKGARRHTLPLTDSMVALLRSRVGHHPRSVFTFVARKSWVNPKTGAEYKKGERYPCTHWGLATWFKRSCKALGRPHLCFHDLRRTAASQIVTNTGSLKAAQMLLGHTSAALTAKYYAHLQMEDLCALMERTEAVSLRKREDSG